MISTAAPATSWLKGIELEELDDEAYYLRCRAVGYRLRQDDDRYIGLLVGAFDRDLPRKRGFRDITHMAGVQARMPRKRVTEILSIARAIRSCPALYRLFTRAEASWTKVRAVARLASPERDAELCSVVRRMTRTQLVAWIREQSQRRPPAAVSRSGAAPADSSGKQPGAATAGAARAGAAAGVAAPTGAAAIGAVPVTAALRADPGSVGLRFTGDPCAVGVARDCSTSAALVASPDIVRGRTTGLVPEPGAQDAAPKTLAVPGATALARAPVDPESPGNADPTMDLEPDGRVRPGARALEARLLKMGLDPLVLDKLRMDREVIAARDGATPPLIDVLEQAIRGNRPAGPSVKLPYVHVISMCPECRCRTVRTRFGTLPVDEADERDLRQSGEAIDLDQEPLKPDGANPEAMAPSAPGVAAPAAEPGPDCGSVPGPEPGPVSGRAPEPAEKPVVAPDPEPAVDNETRHPGDGEDTSSPATQGVGAGPTSMEPRNPPARIKRIVLGRQGGRCAVPNCLEVLGQCHHRTPFAWSGRHDPDQLHWVCRKHHDLVHAGGIANPGDAPDRWRPWRGPGPAGDARHRQVELAIRHHSGSHRRRDEELARRMTPEPSDEPDDPVRVGIRVARRGRRGRG